MVQSKSDKDRQKIINDKCQSLIEVLLKDEDNKYCVDCDAKGPRWASWNLGIFLCIRCAGIHRNLGVHISKVKSVNLDSWGPEHVAYIQRMGNSRARAIYEANLPDDFRRPQTDTALETFVRAKYEQKKYLAQGWTDPGPPIPAFDIEEELKKLKEQKRNKNKQAHNATTLIRELPSSTISQPRPTEQHHQTSSTTTTTTTPTTTTTTGLATKDNKINNNNKSNSIPGQVGINTVAATIAANNNRNSNSSGNGNANGNDKINSDNSLLDLFDLGSTSTTNDHIDPFENFTISSPKAAGGVQNNDITITTKATTLPSEDLFGAFCNDQSSLSNNTQPYLLSSSTSADHLTPSSNMLSHSFGGAPVVSGGGTTKKILTKESILSLYSLSSPISTTTTTTSSNAPSSFADPFGMMRQK